MRMFDPDGPVMGALGKLADLALCNVLFLLCSLPVFTMGASLTAMYQCTLRLAEDKEPASVVRQFFSDFRKGFKRSTALWLLCLAVMGLLYLYSLAAKAMGGALSTVYGITFYVLVFLFACIFLYIFPLQAKFHPGVRETLKHAAFLSAAALPFTLAALAVAALAVFLTFYLNPDGISLYLWMVLLFALVAYLNSFLILRAFRRVGLLEQDEDP